MRDELEHIAQIDEYLQGEMSPEELQMFEEALKNNAGLREEVFFQKEANQLLIIGELHDLEKRVKKYHYTSSKKNINSYKNGAIGLAGLLLLAGLFSYFLNTTHTESLGISRKVTLTPTPVDEELVVKEKKQQKTVKTLPQEDKRSVQQHEERINLPQSQKKPQVTPIQDTIVTNKVVSPNKTDTLAEESVTANEKDSEIATKLKTEPSENDKHSLEPVTAEPDEEYEVFYEEEEKNYDLAFSPSRGQELNWPVEEDFVGTILLYNMNGHVIYEKKFDGYQNTKWNGITKRGDVISFGVYPVMIHPANGGKPVQGSLTVVE